jgi:hypothetical protein
VEFEQEGKIQPAGTQFLGLVDSLIDLFKVPTVSNVEVIFISYKLDEKGEKTVEDGMHVVEFNALVIRGIGPEVREELRKKIQTPDLLVSLLVLWLDSSRPGKIGIQKFYDVLPGESPKAGDYLPWEQECIGGYMKRHKL